MHCDLVVRAEVKGLMEDFLRKPGNDVRLAAQARKMELPMLFFMNGNPIV